MPATTSRYTVWLVLALVGSATAAPIVNAPQPITQQVIVQPIIVRSDDGSIAATYFGSGAQETQILQFIDQIWAQAGIDVSFLAPNFYNDSFALNNNGNTAGTRPTGHLDTIVDNAGAPPKSATATTINMFFVDYCPGFGVLSENTAAGLAYVGGNGITMFVGDNLLGSEGGRTVIAGVVAHEIGHNLGLDHTANALPNLMSPSGTTDQLDAGQITTALNSNLSVPIPEPSTVLTFGALVVGLGWTARRRRRAA